MAGESQLHSSAGPTRLRRRLNRPQAADGTPHFRICGRPPPPKTSGPTATIAGGVVLRHPDFDEAGRRPVTSLGLRPAARRRYPARLRGSGGARSLQAIRAGPSNSRTKYPVRLAGTESRARGSTAGPRGRRLVRSGRSSASALPWPTRPSCWTSTPSGSRSSRPTAAAPERGPPPRDQARPRFDVVCAAVEAYWRDLGRAAPLRKTLDVTGRVAGIGSLGVLRYTVLVAGGGSSETNRLFDLKYCLPSSLEPCAARPWPFPDESDAARVVRAQRMLQAAPDGRAYDVLDRAGETPCRIREMIPEENRSRLSRFNKKPGKLRGAPPRRGRTLARRRLAPPRREPCILRKGGSRGAERWASGPAARLGPRPPVPTPMPEARCASPTASSARNSGRPASLPDDLASVKWYCSLTSMSGH